MVKKFQKISMAALAAGVFPLLTFIPALLKITLPVGSGAIWAGANIVAALAGLCLSIVCVKNKKSRSGINITALLLNVGWVSMMTGVVMVAMMINFLQ